MSGNLYKSHAVHGDSLMLNSRTIRRLVFICSVGLVPWLGVGRAQAQGAFGGFGWGLGPQTPASVNFLNDHANARVGSVAARQPRNLRAPTPVVRDVEFFNRYDAATRAAMEDRVARYPRRSLARPTQTPPATVAENPPQARPASPLSSFFNKARQLVWPADAPKEGEWAAKRSSADAKTLEVLIELEMHGYALVATATDARIKLIDYGRPALQFLRENATTGVADAFHSFLLSLYDSIGESPNPPRR
jgi:hypothetical protein